MSMISMGLSLRFWLACAICFIPSAIFSDGVMVDQTTGASFPKEVSFEMDGKNYILDGIGVGTRKKLVVKVYTIASYLQKGVKLTDQDKFKIMTSDESAKQLTIKWVRDVPGETVIEGYKNAFEKQIPQELENLKGVMGEFENLFAAGVKKDDEHIIRWAPEGHLEVLINGKRVWKIADEAFAKGLWSIWYGDKSPVTIKAA